MLSTIVIISFLYILYRIVRHWEKQSEKELHHGAINKYPELDEFEERIS